MKKNQKNFWYHGLQKEILTIFSPSYSRTSFKLIQNLIFIKSISAEKPWVLLTIKVFFLPKNTVTLSVSVVNQKHLKRDSMNFGQQVWKQRRRS